MHIMKAARNRLAHHEPLWKPQNIHNVIEYLNKIYSDIFETIRWISEDCCIYLTQHMPMKDLFDKCSALFEHSITEQNEIVKALKAISRADEETDNI